ncbi:MAG: NAD-dependent epimerase/dehydratase family protein [Paracoccaceae bacterium]
MATYLVTGGCGFIGSHLCLALLEKGHGVHVLDDLSTGRESNLAPGASLQIGDIRDAAVVGRALHGVDGCFHLAAIASVERGSRDWLGTHHVNLGGFIQILEIARAQATLGKPAIPVVYASSAAIYGDNPDVPLSEASIPRPLSAYGADKLGCELHARVAGAVHGVPTMGLRFFNVYGPRQDPRSPYSGVISIFCARLTRGEPIDVNGDGHQTRDFIHVSDVVAALIRGIAMAGTEAPVLNVCTGRPTSVLDLATTIAEACGTKAEIRHRPGRPGEIRHSLGDRRQLAHVLDVRSTTAIGPGIAEVVAWIRAGEPGLCAPKPGSADQPDDCRASASP